MSGKKISELQQATTLSNDSLFVIVSGSVTYKTTLDSLNYNIDSNTSISSSYAFTASSAVSSSYSITASYSLNSSSPLIQKTKSQMDVLSGSNGFIPGQLYKITGVNQALYGGTDIFIKAATTNKLELAGHGLFYNPKYINSQATPNNGYGIWRSTNSYSVGNKAIWGGKHWINTSGATGTSTNKYTLSSADWTVIPFNDTDYNVEIDVIHYDHDHDMIIRRKDRFNNDVDGNFQIFDEFSNPNAYAYGNPIKDFQWGNYSDDWNTNDYWYIGVQSNFVKDSYLECINFVGSYLFNNTLNDRSYIYNNTTDYTGYIAFNELNNASKIKDNTVTNTSAIHLNNLIDASIESNSLNAGEIHKNNLVKSSIGFNTVNSSAIYSNDLRYSSISQNNINAGNIQYNTLDRSGMGSNSISSGGYISENKISYSQLLSNTLTGGFIYRNEISNYSYIADNVVLDASYIRLNIVRNRSSIGRNLSEYASANTLKGGSVIGQNIIDNYSAIYDNLLIEGSIVELNSILNKSTFSANKLGNASSIFQNYISEESDLTSNTLTGSYSNKIYQNKLEWYTSFYSNKLSGSSCQFYNNEVKGGSIYQNNLIGSNNAIDSNIMDPNGARGGFGEIGRNNLSGSAYISSNKLFQGGGIEYNNLKRGEIYLNFITRDSGIYSNMISGSSDPSFGFGFCAIDENNLSAYSYIQDNKLFLDSDIYMNKISEDSYIQNNNITGSGKIVYNSIEYSTNIRDNNFSGSIFIQSSSFFSTRVSFGLLTGSKEINNLHAKNCDLNYPISASTIIFQPYYKQAYVRQDGTTRLGYYNNSDAFVAVSLNA